MITTEYLWMLAAALIVSMLMLACKLHMRSLKAATAGAALLICGLLGIGCALLSYKALMFMMPVTAFSYCFTGGVLGVVIGLMLAAKLCKQPILPVLDASAAPVCVMVMLARLGEHFMKNVGWGQILDEDSWLCRVPFGVPVVWDEWYTEWYAAIYLLEAVLALAAVVVTLLILERLCKKKPGMTFECSMYLLVIPQILSEQLRSMPMAWGFVKVEQILCAIIAAFLLGRACHRWYRHHQNAIVQAWWPVAAFLACVGVVMAGEFALDGKIEWPVALSWTLFIGSLAVMLGLEAYAACRLNKDE